MLETIVALMLALSPRVPETRARPIAQAIANVSESRDEAAELVVLSFLETGFGRQGPPFGVRRRGRHGATTLDEAAGLARRVLRTAREQCGPALEGRMSYYRTGRCGVDDEARRRARIVRRIRSPRVAPRATADAEPRVRPRS